MAKFKVFLQQYVEKTAVVVIEAETPEDARDIALASGAEFDTQWQDGDDAYDVDVYCIKDMDNNEVWER